MNVSEGNTGEGNTTEIKSRPQEETNKLFFDYVTDKNGHYEKNHLLFRKFTLGYNHKNKKTNDPPMSWGVGLQKFKQFIILDSSSALFIEYPRLDVGLGSRSDFIFDDRPRDQRPKGKEGDEKMYPFGYRLGGHGRRDFGPNMKKEFKNYIEKMQKIPHENKKYLLLPTSYGYTDQIDWWRKKKEEGECKNSDIREKLIQKPWNQRDEALWDKFYLCYPSERELSNPENTDDPELKGYPFERALRMQDQEARIQELPYFKTFKEYFFGGIDENFDSQKIITDCVNILKTIHALHENGIYCLNISPLSTFVKKGPSGEDVISLGSMYHDKDSFNEYTVKFEGDNKEMAYDAKIVPTNDAIHMIPGPFKPRKGYGWGCKYHHTSPHYVIKYNFKFASSEFKANYLAWLQVFLLILVRVYLDADKAKKVDEKLKEIKSTSKSMSKAKEKISNYIASIVKNWNANNSEYDTYKQNIVKGLTACLDKTNRLNEADFYENHIKPIVDSGGIKVQEVELTLAQPTSGGRKPKKSSRKKKTTRRKKMKSRGKKKTRRKKKSHGKKKTRRKKLRRKKRKHV